jgi:hypothetical protein
MQHPLQFDLIFYARVGRTRPQDQQTRLLSHGAQILEQSTHR